MEQILPIVIAIEAAAASGIYAVNGNWGSALYWMSAATITIGVILIPRFG